LADIGTESNNLSVVMLLNPGKQDRGVETARVGQDDLLLRGLLHVDRLKD
jgi:hypothetical protein